jgi:hypothetical protein
MKATPARLDSEGNAQPMAKLKHHPIGGACQGPGIPYRNPEWVNEEGERITLTPTEAASPILTSWEAFMAEEQNTLTSMQLREVARTLEYFTSTTQFVAALSANLGKDPQAQAILSSCLGKLAHLENSRR